MNKKCSCLMVAILLAFSSACAEHHDPRVQPTAASPHYPVTILALNQLLESYGPRWCEVHQTAMVEKAVPIRYGKAPFSNVEWASVELNPNCGEFSGGCIIGAPTHIVPVCFVCRSNYLAAISSTPAPLQGDSR